MNNSQKALFLQLSNELPVPSDHALTSQTGFSSRGSSTTQALDMSKQDFGTSQGNVPVYGSAIYQSQKSSYQQSSSTPSGYNVYSSGSQSAQSTFPSASGANSYSASASQPSYSSSYPQSSTSNFNQASPSVSVSASTGYNQTTTTNQVRPNSSSGN